MQENYLCNQEIYVRVKWSLSRKMQRLFSRLLHQVFPNNFTADGTVQVVSFALNPHCWHRANVFCFPSNSWLCPPRICDKMWSCFIHFHSVLELRQALADTSKSLHFIHETCKRVKKKWRNVDRKGWHWGFGAAVILFGDWNRWCALLTSMKWKKIMLKHNIWDSNIKKNDTITGSCQGWLCVWVHWGWMNREQRTFITMQLLNDPLIAIIFARTFACLWSNSPLPPAKPLPTPTCIWHHHGYRARC